MGRQYKKIGLDSPLTTSVHRIVVTTSDRTILDNLAEYSMSHAYIWICTRFLFNIFSLLAEYE